MTLKRSTTSIKWTVD